MCGCPEWKLAPGSWAAGTPAPCQTCQPTRQPFCTYYVVWRNVHLVLIMRGDQTCTRESSYDESCKGALSERSVCFKSLGTLSQSRNTHVYTAGDHQRESSIEDQLATNHLLTKSCCLSASRCEKALASIVFADQILLHQAAGIAHSRSDYRCKHERQGAEAGERGEV